MGRPTTHILTVHHHDDRWIDIQLSQLARHLPAPYELWGSLERVPSVHYRKFDHVIPSSGTHAGKLNLLAAEACSQAHTDDLLLFLDGDAFPIEDPFPTVDSLLQGHDLVAIQRKENAGDCQPHPSFAVTRVGTWLHLQGDWSMGFPWTNNAGGTLTDVGGNLLRALERTATPWAPLLRSNRRNIHPLWFGLYGDVVYHHGAGFRSAVSRVDNRSLGIPHDWRSGNILQRRVHRFRRSVQLHRGKELSQAMFRLLMADVDEAISYLQGGQHACENSAFQDRLEAVFEKARPVEPFAG